MLLFSFDIVNRILRRSVPALDDNSEQGNDEAGKPSSSEYPRAECDAITEIAEPVVGYEICNWCSDNEGYNDVHHETAEQPAQHFTA